MSRGALIFGLLAVALLAAGCKKSNNGRSGGGESLMDQYRDAKALENPVDRAEGLIAVGMKQVAASDNESAELSFKEAAAAIDEIRKEPATQARLYIAVATGYDKTRSRSKLQRTLDSADIAVEAIEEPVVKANRLPTVAALWHAAGDTPRAVEQLTAAENLLEKIPASLDKADVLLLVSRSYAGMDKQAESKRTMEAAAALAEAEKRESDQVRILLRIAAAQHALGQNEVAAATREKALKLARGVEGNPLLKANLLYDVAEAAADVGLRDECRNLLREAQAEADKTPEGIDVTGKVERLRVKLKL